MTEKRFNMEYVHGNPTIWHITDCGEHIVDEKICDLLNALHEENEQLKHDATVLIQANQDYRKENEKLKQQISYYEKLITDKEVEWLRDNTVWEQMPSSKRTVTKTSK